MHFDNVSQANNWTPADQLAYIGLYLSDTAQSYFYSLPAATRQQLPALLQALDQRFAAPLHVDRYRSELQTRRQNRGVSFSTYCEQIRKLARLTYPGLDAGFRDLLAKDQFLNGLDSLDLRSQVRTATPGTLDGALQRACHIYSILDSEI